MNECSFKQQAQTLRKFNVPRDRMCQVEEAGVWVRPVPVPQCPSVGWPGSTSFTLEMNNLQLLWKSPHGSPTPPVLFTEPSPYTLSQTPTLTQGRGRTSAAGGGWSGRHSNVWVSEGSAPFRSGSATRRCWRLRRGQCVPDGTGSQACSEVALPAGWEDLASVIVFARVLLAVTLTAALGNQLNMMDKDQSVGQQGTWKRKTNPKASRGRK